MRTSFWNALSIPTTLLCAALLAAALPTPLKILAETRVYRCTAADGSVEFRERSCQGQDQERALEIRDNRTGWVPPEPEAPVTGKPEGKSRGKPKPRATATDADRYKERCWNKRQEIQGINNELRAGYKPARGERLKRRRREHEAFIDRYCR